MPAEAENVVVGPGAKVFEQFFCEPFLDPGDAVLSSPRTSRPTSRTSPPRRRAGLRAAASRRTRFGPIPNDVEHFIKTPKRPKAIFLNSPHNPTGGVATRGRPRRRSPT